jgi:hypothetical protein
VEVVRVEPGRRLHRDQAQQLQQVVLDHVAQRAGVVGVAGAPLQGDGLLPDDLDPLDVPGVPHRLKDPVGEAQPEQVLDGLQAQEVVGEEDRIRPKRRSRSRLRACASARLRPNGFLTTTPLPSGSPTEASARMAGANAAGGRAR